MWKKLRTLSLVSTRGQGQKNSYVGFNVKFVYNVSFNSISTSIDDVHAILGNGHTDGVVRALSYNLFCDLCKLNEEVYPTHATKKSLSAVELEY